MFWDIQLSRIPQSIVWLKKKKQKIEEKKWKMVYEKMDEMIRWPALDNYKCFLVLILYLFSKTFKYLILLWDDIFLESFIFYERNNSNKSICTWNARHIVKRTVIIIMPPSPTRWRVRRPARSTKTNETSVMSTLILPIPKVALRASSSLKPALKKISVEKNIA